jgi:putative solute:sodium symporter small subunit
MALTEKQGEYWYRNVTLTSALIAIWFVITFVMAYYARQLAEISFFGWPLSFYMAAQGCLLIYLVLIFFYTRRMRRLDEEYGVSEGDDR